MIAHVLLKLISYFKRRKINERKRDWNYNTRSLIFVSQPFSVLISRFGLLTGIGECAFITRPFDSKSNKIKPPANIFMLIFFLNDKIQQTLFFFYSNLMHSYLPWMKVFRCLSCFRLLLLPLLQDLRLLFVLLDYWLLNLV